MTYLACMSNETFQVFDEAMEMYEEGKLSGQKEVTGLETKRDIPFSTFRFVLGLDEGAMRDIWEEVKNGEMTIKQMTKETETIKKLQIIQVKLLQLLKIRTWEEACREFPTLTCRDSLLAFRDCSFRNKTPDEFSRYVMSATTNQWVGPSCGEDVISFNNATGVVLEGDATEVGTAQIVTTFRSFEGAALVIVDPPEASYI
ncbi:PREDICTED: uncharacterized protein LOC106807882 [Priapulus caudatus]|uniref:Uncharacterized protein LOC106807882 n=1 Tax=Priapulus caudatus TaxID=37621 RepID=A0ABM1E0Z3_PRICU|nr:PREDICTED: uncharacterized protein LOC106807882 [Priapulus caudatus]